MRLFNRETEMNLDAYYDDLYERTETSAEYCEYCDARIEKCKCHQHDDCDRRRDEENE